VGVNWIRRGDMKLKTRCVDGTNYVKIVQPITIGNSMLNYASNSLDGVEVIGGGVRALSMEKAV
jgi:hypothetical protein